MSEKPSLADVTIRPAVAEDQATIKQIIHEATIKGVGLRAESSKRCSRASSHLCT